MTSMVQLQPFDKNNYDSNLTSIITTFKPQINLTNFATDYTISSNFTNDIISLIGNEERKYQGIIRSYKNKDLFFHKSFMTLLLPFDNYIPYNNGELITNSGNCNFTIADVSINSNPERIFIKIVDIPTAQYHVDHLLYDVIASIIFDYIFKIDKKYEKFIPEYRGCFPSYYFVDSSTIGFWNYNDINDFTNQDKSPFNYKTFLLNFSKQQKCLTVMYKAINDPINLRDFFIKYIDSDKDKYLDVLKKSCKIYELLKDLGLNYGFMHNDLHLGNILYDETTTELKLIDFGRASFGKYIDEINDDIINKIKVEYTKLNYDRLFRLDLFNSRYNGINSLEEFLYKDQRFFPYAYSIKLTNNKYFGIILDLITFSLNIYLRTICYFYKHDNLFYDQIFEPIFKKLIIITFNTSNINDLLKNTYTSIDIPSNITSIATLIANYREVREFIDGQSPDLQPLLYMLAEGLFYTSLYIFFIKPSSNIRQRIYPCFQILDDTIPHIIQFKDMIKTQIIDIPTYNDIILKDSFLRQFLPIISSPLIPGGNKRKTSKLRKAGESSVITPIDSKMQLLPYAQSLKVSPNIITLEHTAKAYINVFNNIDNYIGKPTKGTIYMTGGNKTNKRILKKY